mmetsp:Transcript_26363/g.45361  ORF Transcript_26363/g.45361 Transcript_26363/m.45361 type:complete len:473 (+) Transcript_26363:83-1501(+)
MAAHKSGNTSVSVVRLALAVLAVLLAFLWPFLRKSRSPATEEISIPADRGTSALVLWTKSQGVHTALSPVFFNETGVGLAAKGKIPEGRNLLKIPAGLILNCDGSSFDEILPQNVSVRHNWCWALRLLEEKSKRNRSFWHPYVESLPQHIFLPWDLPDDQLEQIKNADVQELTSVKKSELLLVHQSVLEQRPDLFTSPESSLSELRWAAAVVFSRAWDMGLVPFADLANHSRRKSRGAVLRLEKAPGDGPVQAVSFVTTEEMQPGQQFFISYGEKPGSRLLALYGFVPEAEDDIVCTRLTYSIQQDMERSMDSVDALSLLLQSGLLEEGFGVQGRTHVYRTQEFCLGYGEIPPEVWLFFRLTALNSSELSSIDPHGPKSLLDELQWPRSPDHEVRAIRSLAQVPTAMLNSEVTTIQADQEALAKGYLDVGQSLSIRLRINRKVVLNSVLEALIDIERLITEDWDSYLSFFVS